MTYNGNLGRCPSSGLVGGGWVRAEPSEAESFGGPLADIVRFTNLLYLAFYGHQKKDSKCVNFSVISRQGNGRTLVARF